VSDEQAAFLASKLRRRLAVAVCLGALVASAWLCAFLAVFAEIPALLYPFIIANGLQVLLLFLPPCSESQLQPTNKTKRRSRWLSLKIESPVRTRPQIGYRPLRTAHTLNMDLLYSKTAYSNTGIRKRISHGQ
jgi:hypothetical protein